MEVHQIKYFLGVCEARNFTRAARSCNVTQPSLTRAIQNLEYELGGQLFERKRSAVLLTPLGKAVRDHFLGIQREFVAVKSLAEKWKKGIKGILRFGAVFSISTGFYSEFLAGFQKTHPDLIIDLIEGTETKILETFKFGGFDAVFSTKELQSNGDIKSFLLGEERLSVVAKKNHRIFKKSEISLRDLEGLPYLERTQGLETFGLEKILQDFANPLKTIFSSNEDSAILSLTKTGVGFSLFSEREALPSALHKRVLVDPEIKQPVFLHILRNSNFPKGRSFLETWVTQTKGTFFGE